MECDSTLYGIAFHDESLSSLAPRGCADPERATRPSYETADPGGVIA